MVYLQRQLLDNLGQHHHMAEAREALQADDLSLGAAVQVFFFF